MKKVVRAVHPLVKNLASLPAKNLHKVVVLLAKIHVKALVRNLYKVVALVKILFKVVALVKLTQNVVIAKDANTFAKPHASFAKLDIARALAKARAKNLLKVVVPHVKADAKQLVRNPLWELALIVNRVLLNANYALVADKTVVKLHV